MDGVSVQCYIMNVKSGSTHVFFTKYTLLSDKFILSLKHTHSIYTEEKHLCYSLHSNTLLIASNIKLPYIILWTKSLWNTIKSEAFHKHTSFVAHWNPATTLSLISFKYWTPFVTSHRMLGPVPSGPKHQIFLASPTSIPNLSAKILALSFISCLAVMSPCQKQNETCITSLI